MTRGVLGALALAVGAGCGGVGRVDVTVWGEAFIEERLPASEFADGWEVTFQKFLVSVRDVELSVEGGAPVRAGFEAVVDLTRPGPTLLRALADVPAGRYTRFQYALAPAATAQGLGGVSPADVARFTGEGRSVWVQATASRGASRKTFDWAFTGDTLYGDCADVALGGTGLVVPVGAQATAQLTIHGDHLFYDDLQSESARLRFDALAAADADADGVVTLEELGRVSLTSLPVGQYGTAGAAGVRTLRDFVTALTRTLGHFQGEGECVARSRGS